jgi:hypothetical protein
LPIAHTDATIVLELKEPQMAQFKKINEKAEVNGQAVLSIANGLGALKAGDQKFLEANGLKDVKPGGWYPQQNWLDAFKQISENVGVNTLNQIGKSIPDNAQFPPEMDDVPKALAAIDVAYHMNHRLNGNPLFNPADGTMTKGIGHCHYRKIGENKVEIKFSVSGYSALRQNRGVHGLLHHSRRRCLSSGSQPSGQLSGTAPDVSI